jgi:hypothetical protein
MRKICRDLGIPTLGGAAAVSLGYVAAASILDMRLPTWPGLDLIQQILCRLSQLGILVGSAALDLFLERHLTPFGIRPLLQQSTASTTSL